MRLGIRPQRLTPLSAALAASVVAAALLGAGAVAAASTNYVSNCSVNLRTSASTGATIAGVIATGTLVTASGSVSGSSWSATCGGSNLAGSSWYVITAVNGTSTSTLYGKSAVYGATGLFSLAPAPPPPGSYLEGIDVSHWQGSINWSSVAAAGKKFAVMKATESTIYADSQYPTWHPAARSVGIRVGAYHFAQPSTTAGDAVAEADWFVSHANLLAGDLNPALDLEVSNGLSTSALQAWVGAWLTEVYQKTGVRPMIYTSPSFWRNYMGDTRSFADQGYTVLWVAHWFVTSPSVPGSNWGGHGWTFWQYSDCGSVSGISGCVDLDRYNGTDLTKVTYGANFTVAPSPASQSVKQGVGTSFSVAINRTWFTLPVTLSVSGAPAGTTLTLDSTTVSGSSTTLHVTTSRSGTVTPVGTYPLTITATGNGLTRTATASLVVTDGIAPTVANPSSRLFAITQIGATTTPGKTLWSGSDPSGIGSYALHWQVNAGGWNVASLGSSTSTSFGQGLAFGATYRFRVQATDTAGNVSAWIYGPNFKPMLLQESSSSIAYSSGWKSASSIYASGGALKYSTGAGAWASYTCTCAGVSWIAARGPNRGSAKVYIDGAYITTVSLYSTGYLNKQVLFARNWTTQGTHTIRVVNLATAGHPRIDVDGFARFVLT
jgi:GH25 family lysozyme M1 (1,4-beta-N-acetylmuramidase)